MSVCVCVCACVTYERGGGTVPSREREREVQIRHGWPGETLKHTHTRKPHDVTLTENNYQYHYCIPVNAIMRIHTIYTQNTSPHLRLVWYTL